MVNRVDLALVVLVSAAALRGYWRGFFRECFGLLALAGGIAAAAEWTAAAAALVPPHGTLPPVLASGVAFVGIFGLVHLLVSFLGVVFDRLVSGAMLRGVNRAAGVLFAGAKAVAVLAFVLLFLHVFPIVPGLDERIMSSGIGRPLVTAAGDVVRLGVQPSTPDKA